MEKKKENIIIKDIFNFKQYINNVKYNFSIISGFLKVYSHKWSVDIRYQIMFVCQLIFDDR
jgi:hypothetical protein